MFRIREEQFQALGRIQYERFVVDAVAHVGTLWPFVGSPAAQVEAWVRPRIEQATSIGLSEELVVLRFLETAALFGDAFTRRREVVLVLADVERATRWDDTMQMLRSLEAALGPADEAANAEVGQPS